MQFKKNIWKNNQNVKKMLKTKKPLKMRLLNAPEEGLEPPTL